MIKLTDEQAKTMHSVLAAALRFKPEDITTLRKAGLNKLASKVEKLCEALKA